ncbi:energy transducer TonB [Mucilaginibacter pedocola]|uniref:TonB C-terminal domain-containing protein n=1 Tax=Mucilaginibacter pedocola TaxID=1792845 RepID=A0A1S9PK37_9SPHI|nr:energy transducer TonB [Mucilaginibacter pedocola]OOQ61307.1 hypothetical protein BC343_20195 [Mucilaginibacter pedocola]
MKPKLFIIGLLLIGKAYAQETIAIDDRTATNEVYHVLKSDSATLQGKYTRFSRDLNPTPEIEGYFRKNKKDSVWRYYSGSAVTLEAFYKDDEKVGTWTGFARGMERLKYDFANNKLLVFFPTVTDTLFKVTATTDPTLIVERKPIYVNGMQALVNFLKKQIRYPATSRENNKQGEIIINVMIDEKGNVTDYVVAKTLDAMTEKETLRVFGNLSDMWIPGMVNGKPAATMVEIPVVFALDEPRGKKYRPDQVIVIGGVSERYRR